jgi:hypothetical protein
MLPKLGSYEHSNVKNRQYYENAASNDKQDSNLKFSCYFL